MNREKSFDLAAVILIAAVGLFTAYVTFGILESSASAEIQRYSVGGAIAGALVTISLLASVYQQFRKSSVNDEVNALREDKEKLQKQLSREDELKELRRQNVELQQKLLRGAPRPQGFYTEVSERERIVLARPHEWEPRGGVIFDFELPESSLLEGDIFPARFTCWYEPVTDEHQDDFYRRYLNSVFDASWVESHTSEYVYLGGETQSIRSLKIIAQEYAYMEIQKDTVTGKIARNWRNVSKDEYEAAFSAEEALSEPVNEQSMLPADGSQAAASEPQPAVALLSEAADSENTASHEAPLIAADGSEAAARDPQPATALMPEPMGSQEPVSYEAPLLSDLYMKIFRMRVVCFHQDLSNIFTLEFLDDAVGFADSSAMFNQILNSVRFLS